MAEDYIKKALHEVVKEYFKLKIKADLSKRQALEFERQRFALLPKIHALAEYSPPAPDSPIGQMLRRIAKSGLTSAVGNILEGTGEWMSPSQIRDEMIRFRVDLTRYKNPVSSIHTILKRWVESGEVEQKEHEKSGKAVFRWKPPMMLDDVSLDDDATTEQLAEYMLDPRRTKKRKKKRGASKAVDGSEEPLLIMDGSLKVN